MYEAIPEPLPKCFWPLSRYARGSGGSGGVPGVAPAAGLATALVWATSPPLPGSDVIVPHHAPSRAARPMRSRCASQAVW
jgi:hypothetical protein